MSQRRKKLLVLFAVLTSCGLLLYLRVPLLRAMGQWLVVEDSLHPADIIFLLNGEEETRPFHTAELYEQGLAPRIVIAQVEESPLVEMELIPDSTTISTGVLDVLGIPAENVVVLNGVVVTSTRDEAEALANYVREQGVERIILVTSAFHTRRSEWIIRKLLDGAEVELEVSPAPHYGFDTGNWWQNEDGLLAFANEYLKLAFYLVSY